METEYDLIYKCIVVGDGGVGKTALAVRLCKGFFIEDYKMTIGVDFYIKTTEIDDLNIKLQIWDTGGQERFNSIRSIYYQGTRGAAIVFDLSNQESFEHIPRWVDEIKRETNDDIPILLIGNKSDLINSREVTSEDIYNITRQFNLLYMETSAKTGAEVSKCFDVLTHLIMDLSYLSSLKDTMKFKIEPQEKVEIKKDKEIETKIEQVLKHIRERQRVIDNTKKKKKKGL
jgi:small GTP-binding protein